MKSTSLRESISRDIEAREQTRVYLQSILQDRDQRTDAVYWLNQERELHRDVERRRLFLQGLQEDFSQQHALPFAQTVAPSLDYPAPLITGRELRLQQVNDALSVLERQRPGVLWIVAIMVASAIGAIVIAASMILVAYNRLDSLLP